MILTTEIKQYLSKEKIALVDFQKVIMRLLDNGVICRDESLIEQETYDLFLRTNDLVVDFFSLLNIQILHDTTFQYVRAFPPGSHIPGEKEEFNIDYRGFRRNLNQAEITLLLVLRVLYEQKILEGQVSDKGTVDVTLEDIHITFTQSLNRELPEKIVDRKSMYQTLKRLRVIHYQADDLDSNQCLISIKPIISSYTFEYHEDGDAEANVDADSDDSTEEVFKVNDLKVSQVLDEEIELNIEELTED